MLSYLPPEQDVPGACLGDMLRNAARSAPALGVAETLHMWPLQEALKVLQCCLYCVLVLRVISRGASSCGQQQLHMKRCCV